MLQSLKTRKFWLGLIRDICIIIFIVYLVNLYQTRNTPNIIPALEAQLISGEPYRLSEHAQTSPVLIYFWGSWCPLCSMTSSTVSDLAKDYSVVTIALSSGDEKDVQAYLNNNAYQFPVINEPDGKISLNWGVSGTPTFFIIDSQGDIASVTMGATSRWGLQFRLWLASLKS